MKQIASFLFRGRGRVLGFASVGVIACSLTASAAAPWKMRQASARTLINGFGADPVASESLRPGDRSFLGKAMEMVRQQMRLAEVGVSQAANSDVRKHAQQLVGDYRQLNDTLDALIRRKGGIAGAPVGGTSENYQKLVETSGGAFDAAFLKVAGHLTDETLNLFEQVASESKDSDVREFAAAQLPVLRAHRSASTELRKSAT
jgi:putative membrane protein